MPIQINFRFFLNICSTPLFCSAYRLSLAKKAVQRAKTPNKKRVCESENIRLFVLEVHHDLLSYLCLGT